MCALSKSPLDIYIHQDLVSLKAFIILAHSIPQIRYNKIKRHEQLTNNATHITRPKPFFIHIYRSFCYMLNYKNTVYQVVLFNEQFDCFVNMHVP